MVESGRACKGRWECWKGGGCSGWREGGGLKGGDARRRVYGGMEEGDGGWRMHEQWPRTAKEKPKSDFRQPRGQLNRQTDSPNGRDNSLFFQG